MVKWRANRLASLDLKESIAADWSDRGTSSIKGICHYDKRVMSRETLFWPLERKRHCRCLSQVTCRSPLTVMSTGTLHKPTQHSHEAVQSKWREWLPYVQLEDEVTSVFSRLRISLSPKGHCPMVPWATGPLSTAMNACPGIGVHVDVSRTRDWL